MSTGVIQKWGNSSGIRIPKVILSQASISPNDEVDIMAEDGKIIIRKAARKRHMRLEERLKDFQGEYVFEEADWGKPVGNEIW
ncbi:MAG: AbrB/MazE/SpoVT family DNA-binding domain-containing protein [Oscillospiraceae bacterium]|nr:AbrB/MazE/SpoVT family DNA-binding domain-containing protein [Oscillospiraceae bacterium]